jgi:hypothetical protein
MTKARKHSFVGESDAENLVSFLNAGTQRGQKRVEKIIELYAKIGKGPPKPSSAANAELFNSLQKLLNDYSFTFLAWHHTSTLAPTPNLKAADRADEAIAVLNIHALRRMNLLSRVRRCLNCREWLFARVPTKRFCKESCRILNYQSNPAWIKKHNKQRQRNYAIRKANPQIKIQQRKGAL